MSTPCISILWFEKWFVDQLYGADGNISSSHGFLDFNGSLESLGPLREPCPLTNDCID